MHARAVLGKCVIERYHEAAVKEAISGLTSPIRSKKHLVAALILVTPTLAQSEARKKPRFEHSLRAAAKVNTTKHSLGFLISYAPIVPQVIDSWDLTSSDPCELSTQLIELCFQTVIFASLLQQEDDSRLGDACMGCTEKEDLQQALDKPTSMIK